MQPHSMVSVPKRVSPGAFAGANLGQSVRMPLAVGARVANIVYTSQFQLAYACASNAQQNARRSIDRIRASWPASPLRDVLLNIYEAQERSADAMAHELLAGARRNCGLAFARTGYRRP